MPKIRIPVSGFFLSNFWWPKPSCEQILRGKKGCEQLSREKVPCKLGQKKEEKRKKVSRNHTAIRWHPVTCGGSSFSSRLSFRALPALCLLLAFLSPSLGLPFGALVVLVGLACPGFRWVLVFWVRFRVPVPAWLLAPWLPSPVPVLAFWWVFFGGACAPPALRPGVSSTRLASLRANASPPRFRLLCSNG